LGRAVSISEVTGRDRPGLAATLTAAGQLDLLRRYEDATRELAAAERAAAEQAEAERAGAPEVEELSSPPQRAWARFDAVAREVSLATHAEHLVGRVGLDDLVAAARTGPLVYLAAAMRFGYAIVVTAAGVESWLLLPALTRDRVAEQAAALLLAPGSDRLAALALAQQWLRRASRAELDAYLPGVLPVPPEGSTVTPAERARGRPFSHPYYWPAFAVTGS
jgi:hypothetical protein